MTWRAGVLVAAAAGAIACVDYDPIRVGVVSSGEGVVGARFAAAEINRTSGIRGRPLLLRVAADGDVQTQTAVVAAESLSTDPTVIAVVGHSNSSASLAAAQIYNLRRVVQIAPTSSSARMTGAGPYTFRLVASDVHQARFLADELVRRSVGAVAVFYVNDDYGKPLFQELSARLTQSHVRITLEASHSAADTLPDAESSVAEMVRSGTRDVVWLGRVPQLQRLLPVLRRHVPNARILAGDGIDSREVTANAMGIFTGITHACFVDVNGARHEIAALRERYRARTGRVLTAELALTYDAVMLVAAAAREAGPRRGAILDYMRSLGRTRPVYRGATGDIEFDEGGDPRPSYCLAEIAPPTDGAARPETR
jgi:branched-chain amino acid transport system substrate-binding protein